MCKYLVLECLLHTCIVHVFVKKIIICVAVIQHLCSECSQAKGEIPHGAGHTVYKPQFRGSSPRLFQNEAIDREKYFWRNSLFLWSRSTDLKLVIH